MIAHECGVACAGLRSSRERLCLVQTNLERAYHRKLIQDSIDNIDRVGSLTCSAWSKHDLPSTELDQ